MKKTVIKIAVFTFLAVFTFACVQFDDSFTESIFEDVSALDPTSETYTFDRYLQENYLKIYNLDFLYKMQDVGSDTEYNLVPTELEKSKQLAILAKYLWFDAYGEVVGSEFLKEYGPRIIHLIGSGAYNPNLGTVILGSAEGGIKVTLYECNQMDPTKVEVLNEYYFKTMHHEFAHILHQQKTYPKDFETYSAGHYDPGYWQERADVVAASLGFASPYGSSQPREDFVEIIANFIVKSDAWWDDWKDKASKEWTIELDKNGDPVIIEDKYGGSTYSYIVDTTGVSDGIAGKEVIETKIEICRKWLKESWEIDLDTLRANVQERQLHIAEALEAGFKEIDSYKPN
jgi:substrate import-associated zinc metallohydrolase lipoprotein